MPASSCTSPEPTELESANPRGITVVSTDPVTVAWVADAESVDLEQRERLLVWSEGSGEPEQLVPSATGLGRPAGAANGELAVVVSPLLRAGRYDLEAFCFRGGELVKTLSLATGEAAPGRVAICQQGSGFLVCRESRGTGGRISLQLVALTRRFDVVNLPSPQGEPAGVARSPQLTWDGRRAWLACLCARSHSASWRVVLQALGGPSTAHVVWESRPFESHLGGLALAAAGPDRIWVAWHTDRRPGGRPDLTRWVEVRCLLSGRIIEPVGAPLRRRWGVLGEDQGFEFPALAPLADGGLSLLARSSHRLWRCELSRAGWSEPRCVDEEGWGCRSRRLAVASLPATGQILLARRRRQTVVVETLAPSGAAGRPVFAPATSEAVLAARGAPLPQRNWASIGPTRARGIYFGDLHQHTARSDATGTTREAYERVRDVYADDFTAVTDHESFLGRRFGPGEWATLMAECDAHDEPGRFVTIPGYEWTGAKHPGPGHRCVYWPRSDLPLLGREHRRARTSKDLVAAARELGGLVFPHHVGWTGADAEAHDPQVQTCWEIVSCHGAYEAAHQGPIGQRDVPLDGHFIRDQLDRGLKFGFVGGSDGHGLLWHHGVSRKRDSHRTGLTAVIAPELTREAVFDALRARRCYATSGVPIVLDLSVDGAPMGQEIEARDGSVQVEVFCDGLAPILRAELIGPGGLATSLPREGSTVRATERVAAPKPRCATYLYLRVEQIDGEVAWSSPVWNRWI